MIFDKVVSSPIFKARYLIAPSIFNDPAIIFDLGSRSDGVLSPFIKDWSTLLVPSTTSPSTAKLSPGFATRISFKVTSFIATSTSSPSIIFNTVFGRRLRSLLIELVVLSLAFFSMYLLSIFPSDLL
jgi:hypothetical protein